MYNTENPANVRADLNNDGIWKSLHNIDISKKLNGYSLTYVEVDYVVVNIGKFSTLISLTIARSDFWHFDLTAQNLVLEIGQNL